MQPFVYPTYSSHKLRFFYKSFQLKYNIGPLAMEVTAVSQELLFLL